MGAVVREGARPGVPTPYNQALLLLVKACQEVRSEVVEALPRDGLRRAELRWARSSAKALGPASQRLTTRRCCCWSKPARRSDLKWSRRCRVMVCGGQSLDGRGRPRRRSARRPNALQPGAAAAGQSLPGGQI